MLIKLPKIPHFSNHFGKDPSEVHFLFLDFVKINALQFPPSLKWGDFCVSRLGEGLCRHHHGEKAKASGPGGERMLSKKVNR